MCPNCNNRTGYPLLEELCSGCFTELIIQPLSLAADEAQDRWSDALDRRYRCEVAEGLRPREATPEELHRQANRAPTKTYVAGSYVPRVQRSHEIDEDEVS